MYQEEVIISAAYDMADKIYYMNNKKMRDLGVDVDDFRQDSVMHILKLHRSGYMQIDEDYKPEGMIFTLLSQYHQNYMTLKIRDDRRSAESLNTLYSKRDYDIIEKVDMLTEENILNPEDSLILNTEKVRGKELLDSIVSQFDVTPIKTRKYRYISKENKSFSEYNLAKMIISGYNVEKILKEYNVYTKNIGTSSKASVVNRKIKVVLEKLKMLVSKLDENDRKAIAYYAKSL